MKVSTLKLKNGFELPVLGIGTTDLKADNDGAVKIGAAIELGYRLIDTATSYQNHDCVAQALQDAPIPREEIIVCSKFNDADLKNNSVREVVERMLQELQLDYLDILLLHAPAVIINFPQRNIMPELVKLKAEGKIKCLGVSNFSIEHLQLISEHLPHVEINQIEINPYCQQPAVVDFCAEHGIHLMAYRPFGKGKASDLLANPHLQQLALQYDKTPYQIILRWLTQKGFISIPKAGNPAHLKENSACFSFELTPVEMQLIEGLNRDLITCDWKKYVTTQKPQAALTHAFFASSSSMPVIAAIPAQASTPLGPSSSAS